MKISKSIIISLLLFLSLSLYSATIEVKQDGSGDFIIIQEAINSSANGDTILVHPGTYFENIDMNNHSIALCSLEATTDDSTYIATTIIDGNQTGSCIKVMNGETVTIQGFSLTNGSGTYYNLETQGGGLIAWDFSTLNLISCNIFNNYAPFGGGAFLRYTDAFLSNVNVFNNDAYYSGGGLQIFGWDSDYYNLHVEFDSINKCSVFNNHAISFQDILFYRSDYPYVIDLNLVSFENPDEYYIGSLKIDQQITINYTVYYNDYIDSDLYVAPWGSDENSGLTTEEPWQNINQATYFIKSDSINPHTIHLLPGTYTPDNQNYPITLKSDIILQGESRETTILDGCEESLTNLAIPNKSDNIKVSRLSITNMSNIAVTAYKYCGSQYFEDIRIFNCHTPEDYGIVKFSIADTITIKNVTIENCSSFYPSSIYVVDAESIYIDSLISRNNTVENSGLGNGVNCIHYRKNFHLKNSQFYNNSHLYYDEYFEKVATTTLSSGNAINVDFVESWKIENCLFYDNIGLQDMGSGGGFTLTASSAAEKGYFINNTVVNNTGMRTMFLGGLDTYVMNNVFYNNNSISQNEDGYELFVPNTFPLQFNSHITFANNIIKGGYEGYHDDYPAWNEEVWLNDPIDADPMLDSLNAELPYFPLYYSPVVDGGTLQFPEGYEMPLYDLAGNPRVNGDTIDIGCYEWIDGVGINNEECIMNNVQSQLSNYPNPFNPETTISMSIPQAGRVELKVYNIKGQLVKRLMDVQMEPGEFTVRWNGRDNNGKKSASGTYIAKCSVNGKVIGTQKMTLLK